VALWVENDSRDYTQAGPAGLHARFTQPAVQARATSHLWVDIVAHSHFVPAHEHLGWNVPMLTHATPEWAIWCSYFSTKARSIT